MVFTISTSIIEMCVLAILEREDAYGYKLTQEVVKVLGLSESTIYPVLRRLQKDALLDVYDEPYDGRNRRYYRLTPKGREHFLEQKSEWQLYKEKIDAILGGVKHEQS